MTEKTIPGKGIYIGSKAPVWDADKKRWVPGGVLHLSDVNGAKKDA